MTSRVDMLTHGMMARGADAWTAHQRALAILDRQLAGQASVMAYSKIYVLSAALILCLIPLLLLVRQTKGAAVGKNQVRFSAHVAVDPNNEGPSKAKLAS